ncbi:MAG: hypothetical protein JRG92_20795 [Deltaproteobacteria bacterium]|nr:hypothetical protein [Deltaproteobacteria bacterium]
MASKRWRVFSKTERSTTALPARDSWPNQGMKRALNGAVQMTALPFSINLMRFGTLGGMIQRRLSPIG